MIRLFLLAVLGTVLLQPWADARAAERLPIEGFFKDPEFSNVSLSPSGTYITVSVPQADRTVLAAFKVKDMKLVGKWDQGRNYHIDRVRWVNDDRFIMYVTRKTGAFDYRVGSPDLYLSDVNGDDRIHIPNGGTYQIVDLTWDDPDTILVQRSVDAAFLFKLNVYTGKLNTVARAPLRFGSFVLDREGKVRYAIGSKQEGGDLQTLRLDGDTWTTVHSAPMGESVRNPLMFAEDGERVIFSISDEGEPTRLALVDPLSGKETPLARNANVDESSLLLSGDERTLLAVRYLDGLPEYSFVAPEHPEAKMLAGLLQAFPDHAVAFSGISRDGRFVLLRRYSDVDPGAYFLYDRKTGEARFLLASMDWINPASMSPMRAISFTSRDGTKVHGYLTIPQGSDGKNLPLILHPHGGPHGVRDNWGFNPEVQFLANRGYAVLQVNFRGSGGYGNAFERKGYRHWGTAMIDDMTDAVDWVVAQGIADPKRVCTYGASYGGFAALQSVARNPDKYRCTIGYVGVYSIPMMFSKGDIPQSKSGKAFLDRVQPESLAEQQAQSPLFAVNRIRVPVMLVQGGKDERVPPAQYQALKKALAESGNPVQIDVYEDKEAHGFYDHANKVSLYTKMEAFLDRHIGASAQ